MSSSEWMILWKLKIESKKIKIQIFSYNDRLKFAVFKLCSFASFFLPIFSNFIYKTCKECRNSVLYSEGCTLHWRMFSTVEDVQCFGLSSVLPRIYCEECSVLSRDTISTVGCRSVHLRVFSTLVGYHVCQILWKITKLLTHKFEFSTFRITDQITSLSLTADVHMEAMVGPRRKDHGAALVVEWKVSYVHFANAF